MTHRAWRAAFALAWVVLAGCIAVPACAADPLPVATFFAHEDVGQVQLSPSGHHIALTVAGASGRTVLAVADVASGKPVIVASSPEADIRSFAWVNDDWLVYNVADLQAPLQGQTFGPGLYSVRRDLSESRQLIRVRSEFMRDGSTTAASRLLEANHGLLATLRDGSDDVIVGEYRFDNSGDLSSIVPKRLDVSTGRAVSAAPGQPSFAIDWVFDARGVARAVTTAANGWRETFWRDAADAPWRSVQRRRCCDATWDPIAVDGDGRLYVSAGTAASTSVIKRFDTATGEPESQVLASAPGFDLDEGLVFDPARKRVVGVQLVTDAEAAVWFDDGYRKLQALADARFPGTVNHISCGGCDTDGAMLVKSYSDRDPGTWSLYRPKTGTWSTIGSVRKGIDPRRMADLDLYRVPARDGLELPVWVTRAKSTRGPLPTVLLVHGGPWARGVTWRWNREAQFYASRGYLVIEPEFRSSTGYGQRLFRAGWKHWGTTMQDDLVDAVRWAAAKGWADPARVCIVGASYGGYAALMAPIRYPDAFRCSVAYVAVSDPRLMFQDSWTSDIDWQARQFSLPVLLGDPVRDAEALKAAAPVERAAELKIPVLMAYGADDRRVPIEHGARMRAALQAAGRDPEYVVYDGEGHGFLKPENLIDFYARVEAFLAKNLGGS